MSVLNTITTEIAKSKVKSMIQKLDASDSKKVFDSVTEAMTSVYGLYDVMFQGMIKYAKENEDQVAETMAPFAPSIKKVYDSIKELRNTDATKLTEMLNSVEKYIRADIKAQTEVVTEKGETMVSTMNEVWYKFKN